ncbi:hypothetical protein H1R20_g12791, partial [Candolleomyces eurysporus]
MVRTALVSIAFASTFIVAAVAQPISSFSQEDKFEREFVGSIDDLDLASRADMGVDLVEGLAEREPFWFLAPLIASGIKKMIKKREFLDEDTENSDLFQRGVVEEFVRSDEIAKSMLLRMSTSNLHVDLVHIACAAENDFVKYVKPTSLLVSGQCSFSHSFPIDCAFYDLLDVIMKNGQLMETVD